MNPEESCPTVKEIMLEESQAASMPEPQELILQEVVCTRFLEPIGNPVKREKVSAVQKIEEFSLKE